MKNKMRILRITYWWGIIADALETIRMCFPKLMLVTSGTTSLIPNAELQFGLWYGAPVMLGWTIILFWADRKPVERRGVLGCLLPVILAYMGVEISALAMGIVPVVKMIPLFIVQSIFFSLVLYSWRMPLAASR